MWRLLGQKPAWVVSDPADDDARHRCRVVAFPDVEGLFQVSRGAQKP